jgi:nitroreductase
METWDAIRARRNVGSYQTDAVPAADLDRIAEAAWRAPSASSRQHWDFVVVTDPDQVPAGVFSSISIWNMEKWA